MLNLLRPLRNTTLQISRQFSISKIMSTEPHKDDAVICMFFIIILFAWLDHKALESNIFFFGFFFLVAPETYQYGKGTLNRADLSEQPLDQFQRWFNQAKNEGVPLPEAVNLATAELPSGRVSSRTVLFKELDTDGSLVVYSNWNTSKKAKDIRSNPHAAVTFFWPSLERQVRVEGVTEFLTTEESQIYFDTRPRESRIGAWASPQSQVIKSREELDTLYEQQLERFEGQDEIPCPPFWGGLRIKPLEWEFWQGRPGRVHDRFTYTRDNVNVEEWTVNRIAS